jgi:hypothetical protein
MADDPWAQFPDAKSVTAPGGPFADLIPLVPPKATSGTALPPGFTLDTPGKAKSNFPQASELEVWSWVVFGIAVAIPLALSFLLARFVGFRRFFKWLALGIVYLLVMFILAIIFGYKDNVLSFIVFPILIYVAVEWFTDILARKIRQGQ